MPSAVLIFGVRRCSDRSLHRSSGYLLIFFLGGGRVWGEGGEGGGSLISLKVWGRLRNFSITKWTRCPALSEESQSAVYTSRIITVQSAYSEHYWWIIYLIRTALPGGICYNYSHFLQGNRGSERCGRSLAPGLWVSKRWPLGCTQALGSSVQVLILALPTSGCARPWCGWPLWANGKASLCKVDQAVPWHLIGTCRKIVLACLQSLQKCAWRVLWLCSDYLCAAAAGCGGSGMLSMVLDLREKVLRKLSGFTLKF